MKCKTDNCDGRVLIGTYCKKCKQERNRKAARLRSKVVYCLNCGKPNVQAHRATQGAGVCKIDLVRPFIFFLFMKYADRILVTEIGTELLCLFCKDYWPEDFFTKGRGDKRHSYCRSCQAELQSSRRAIIGISYNPKWLANYRQQRKQKGQCTDCTNQRGEGRSFCQKCLERRAKYQRDYNLGLRRRQVM